MKRQPSQRGEVRLLGAGETVTTPLKPALRQSEKQFMAQVVAYARYRHWRVYHTYSSRRSPVGFPDLVLCRPPRLLFVECKRDGANPTQAQADWLFDLAQSRGDTFVWRPSDWADIQRILR